MRGGVHRFRNHSKKFLFFTASLRQHPWSMSSACGATIIICFPTNSCFISVTVIRWRLAWIFGEVVVGREREVLTTLTHSSPQIAPPSAGWGAGEKWKAGDARWWHHDLDMFGKIPQTFIRYLRQRSSSRLEPLSIELDPFFQIHIFSWICMNLLPAKCVKNPGHDSSAKNDFMSMSSPSSS